MKRKYYFGNNPNNADYDPNVPVGWNQWDAEEVEENIIEEEKEEGKLGDNSSLLFKIKCGENENKCEDNR